ncbi:MAG: type II toxin-antitoxin system HicB family antitoxin, partial [Chloroflexota bacterium]|nr:type II toxin-antitoxin system HicB family antitoxin [Chloroflexota bacterium]
MMRIKAVIHTLDEGGYWAEVPALPGLYAEGATLAEVEARLRAAVENYLADERRLAAASAVESGQVL